jgi:hypothetical protein
MNDTMLKFLNHFPSIYCMTISHSEKIPWW